MAYIITKGVICPGSNPIIEEEQEHLPCNIINFPILPVVPISPNITCGSRVIRKIRPCETGIIEAIILNKDNEIQDIWVNFNGTSIPYPPEDLRQVVVQ